MPQSYRKLIVEPIRLIEYERYTVRRKMKIRKKQKRPRIRSIKKYLKSHIRFLSLCIVILAILLVAIFVPRFLTESEVVSSQEFETYIEEYLSEYTALVNENYALLTFPQSYLSNFTFFLHPPNEIEVIISRTHGAVVFFNTSTRKETKITMKETSEPIEYYVWPQMPKNTSHLPWVLVKAGHYHLDSPVIYDYGLFYLEPGVIMRYTGEGEGLRISGDGAITIFGSVIYEDRMVLKGTNSKEDWSKIQARFDALADFAWDCRGALNETKIEEINSRHKFFLLLDKIAFRMESNRYRDDPDLFRVDYEELEKVCPSNATLSEVLNDYFEMQKTPQPTQLERFWNTYMIPIITTIIGGLIVGVITAYYKIRIAQTKPKFVLQRFKETVERPVKSNWSIRILHPDKTIEKCIVFYNHIRLPWWDKDKPYYERTIGAGGGGNVRIPTEIEMEDAEIEIKDGKKTLRRVKLNDIVTS